MTSASAWRSLRDDPRPATAYRRAQLEDAQIRAAIADARAALGARGGAERRRACPLCGQVIHPPEAERREHGG